MRNGAQIINQWSTSSESSGPIVPFLTSNDILSECGLRWSPSEKFIQNPDDINSLETNPLKDGAQFSPEVLLSLRVGDIFEVTGYKPEDLTISVAVRDRALWKFICACTWPWGEHPDIFAFDQDLISQLSGNRGFEFSISLFINQATIDKNGNNVPAGALIANKIFYLDIKDDETHGGFPVEPCDPELFGEGINKKATWFIRWHEADLSDPSLSASEVLTVLINKNCSDRLYHLRSKDEVGSIFWAEMASEILLEIALVLFRSELLDEPSRTNRGFVARTVRAFVKLSNLNFKQLKALVEDEPLRATATLRSHLQASMGISGAIEKSNIGKQTT